MKSAVDSAGRETSFLGYFRQTFLFRPASMDDPPSPSPSPAPAVPVVLETAAAALTGALAPFKEIKKNKRIKAGCLRLREREGLSL